MSVRPRLVVLGCGGHAKVVISTLQAAGHTVDAVLDDDARKWGSVVLGVPVVGPIEETPAARFDLGVIAVGDNAIRKALCAGSGSPGSASRTQPLTCILPLSWGRAVSFSRAPSSNRKRSSERTSSSTRQRASTTIAG